MRLNEAEILIQPCVSERINGELVIYNESAHKIIVANDITASIWEILCLANKECRDLTTEAIAEAICEKYIVNDGQQEKVLQDVTHALCSFHKASLINEVG